MIAREELHELIDRLPDSELPSVRRQLLEHIAEATNDPVLRAFLDAPLDDEPETEEEREAVARAKEDLAAGRVVSQAEARRRLLGS